MIFSSRIRVQWWYFTSQDIRWHHSDMGNRSFGVGGGSLVKYGWLRHWVAENRLFGSSTRRDRSNEIASFDAAVKISSNGIEGQSSQVRPCEQSGRARWSGQFVSFGVPKTLKIVSNWLISEFPGKNGLRSSNSAKMQPILHMSAAAEYSEAPSKSSGGLYHSVIASGDSRVLGVPYNLARPKSANFIVPFSRYNMLSGFKSRCSIHRSWQTEIARSSPRRCCFASAGDMVILIFESICDRSVFAHS